MNKKIIFLMLFIIIAGVFAFYVTILTKKTIDSNSFQNTEKDKTKNSMQQKNLEEEKITKANGEEKKDKKNNYKESYTNGASSGRGGGVSGNTISEKDVEKETDENCYYQQISYSLKNFSQSSICYLFQEEKCINKSVSCSATIKNLDDLIEGLFELNITFYNEETHERLFLQKIEKEIAPQMVQNFKAELNLYEENASIEVSCRYITNKVPKKLICQ